jgi:prepilin-type N-terminal cleavage/methylation domain-containing protein
MTCPAPQKPDPHLGFTLIELMLVITMLGIVVALTAPMLSRQQRFAHGVREVVEQRTQLRQATAILAAELRSISPADSDIIALSDSAIDMRAHIGSAVICDTAADRQGFDLPPTQPTSGNALAAFTDRPQTGDIAMIFNVGTSDSTGDDTWQRAVITGVANTTSACNTSPLASDPRDASAARTRITISALLAAGVAPGAVVRFTRRVKYRLYSSGGEWYLGRADWNGAAFSTVQPVSGPYRPYASPAIGTSGLAFAFVDSAGTLIATFARATAVASVAITTRAMTKASVRVDGWARGPYADSLALRVALRNRQ